MTDDTKCLSIVRIDRGKAEKVEDVVTRELAVKVFVNGSEVATLMCSPMQLEYLAAGFLLTEGFIRRKEDIVSITVHDEDGIVRVETVYGSSELGELTRTVTASGGRIAATEDMIENLRSLNSESTMRLSPASVLRLMDEFLGRSKTFERTGTTHSAALCGAGGILAFHEDIGRHNAIDKVVGESVLKDLLIDDCVMITSGRITAEVLLKVATCRIPIVLSKSAPTDLAVRLALESGTTLVGFVRGQRMNVYSSEWRIQSGVGDL